MLAWMLLGDKEQDGVYVIDFIASIVPSLNAAELLIGIVEDA